MRSLKISDRITSRESLSLDKYLQEIGRVPLLTPEEEVDLARKIKKGDQQALEKLTKANLRFVVSVAKQYQNNGISLNDLINEGNVGLIKAARRFDETKGFKFISYAIWWIRQTILQAIIEQSRIVRIPMHKVGKYNKVNQAFQDFAQQFEREPSAGELAELLDMKEEEVNSLLSANTRHLSFDAPLSDDVESSNLLDVLPDQDNILPDDRLLKESFTDEILEELNHLTPREREIISSSFGIGGKEERSVEDIADLLDLSPERVRQIKDRALRRLRRAYIKKVRDDYKNHS